MINIRILFLKLANLFFIPNKNGKLVALQKQNKSENMVGNSLLSLSYRYFLF
jgi:hypothetical protein